MAIQCQPNTEGGFSLIEVMVAGVIMTIGLLALAYSYGQGMTIVMSSQQNAIAKQKAREAMEDILAARNTGILQFSQIENASNGGIFLNGPQPLTTANPQGVVGTATDGAVETITLPGPDGILGTPDDTTIVLSGYTRQIQITDVSSVLKQITITVTYVMPSGVTGSYVTTCDVYQSVD